MKKIFCSLFICLATCCYGKVTIYSHYYNRPDFIQIQKETFEKFMQNEFELIIFEDSHKAAISKEIKEECKRLGLQYIRVPNWVFERPYLPLPRRCQKSNASVQCSNANQYIYDTYIKPSSGIFMMIDNDAFMIQETDIEEIMQDHSLAGIPQKRSNKNITINYFCTALMLFNMDTLPAKDQINFNLGFVDGVFTDCGGKMHHYFQKNPDVKFFPVSVSYPSKTEEDPDFHFIGQTWDMEFFLNKSFLHYRAGSNWYHKSNYNQKLADFKESMRSHLNEE